jgi:uncharacterized Ntn-hydrolase superfamily protein
MTYSILARDAETGAIGGAATTGSLCVGGWVLRGAPGAGMSASQGSAPSTFWGEDVLGLMRDGRSATEAVAEVTGRDPGRAHRQLAALDPRGGTGHFTGAESLPACGAAQAGQTVAAGNLLGAEGVPEAVLAGFAAATGMFSSRLLAALRAGQAAGGDSRGLLSAALLVFEPGRPPLTLRVDLSEDPLSALEALHARATSGSYHDWTYWVPVPEDRFRTEAPARS